MIEALAKGVRLYPGDCRAVLAGMAADSVDSCVTDPPYHLTSIVKRFANTTPEREVFAANNPTSAYSNLTRGFMGKQWDGGDIAFRAEVWAEVFRVLKPGAHLIAFGGTRTYHRMTCAIEDSGFEVRDQIGWLYGSGFPKSHDQGGGWGTALKPAWEPIALARKPLIGTVAANMAAHGTGAINVDGCRVERDETTSLERWPANVVHDGSDESIRFFYTAKADADDRLGSKHPTVKPLDLMQWLIRLVTPPGGLVLDPFAGTGTTGEAAMREGMGAALIEIEPEYQADIRRRMTLALCGPDERARESIKARGLAADPGPLFDWKPLPERATFAEIWEHPYKEPVK
jgi:site-specific DNA-methyltransferase (adenine-specific)